MAGEVVWTKDGRHNCFGLVGIFDGGDVVVGLGRERADSENWSKMMKALINEIPASLGL